MSRLSKLLKSVEGRSFFIFSPKAPISVGDNLLGFIVLMEGVQSV